MQEIKFRDLKANEIDLRVGSTKKGNDGKVIGFQLLLYKNQRVDTTILDETFGIFGWKNNYYQVKDTMICSISIWDNEKGQWINKDNGGDSDFQTEQVKAECSDAFKRSAFNLGIGKKLYESPFVLINVDESNTPTSRYSVVEIEYNDKAVTKLFIKNDKTGQVVFTFGGKKSVYSEPKNTKEPQPSVAMFDNDDFRIIREYENNLPQTKKEQFSAWLFRKVGKTDIDKLTEEQAKVVADSIRGSN